ncbi:Hydantoin racemase [Klebsiella aerogenes]|nr:Hydantoin racemase [Klebsiella aerogenes]
MSTICIQVINPNTDPGMRQTIAEAARAAASPGTDIVAVCPPDGVPSIEGHLTKPSPPSACWSK